MNHCKACNKQLDIYESRQYKDEKGKIQFNELCRRCESASYERDHYTQREHQFSDFETELSSLFE